MPIDNRLTPHALAAQTAQLPAAWRAAFADPRVADALEAVTAHVEKRLGEGATINLFWALGSLLGLVVLILVMATHAFFGITIMMQSGLMVAEWFGSMGRTWGATPLADQYLGGGIAWSVGEIPTLILAVIVGIQWAWTDERLQRRRDRHQWRLDHLRRQ